MLTEQLEKFFLKFKNKKLEADYQNFYLEKNITSLKRFVILSSLVSLVILIFSLSIYFDSHNKFSYQNCSLFKVSELSAELLADNIRMNFKKVLFDFLDLTPYYDRYVFISNSDEGSIKDFFSYLDFSMLDTIDNVMEFRISNLNNSLVFFKQNFSWVTSSDINMKSKNEKKIFKSVQEYNTFLTDLAKNFTRFLDNNEKISEQAQANRSILQKLLVTRGTFYTSIATLTVHFVLLILVYRMLTQNRFIINFCIFYISYGLNFHILSGIFRSYFLFNSDTLFIILGVKMIGNQWITHNIIFNWFYYLVLFMSKHALEVLIIYLNHINWNYSLLFYFSANFIFDYSSILVSRNNESFLKSNFFYFSKLKNEKKNLDNLIQNIGHGFISFSLNNNKIIKHNKFIEKLFNEIRDQIFAAKTKNKRSLLYNNLKYSNFPHFTKDSFQHVRSTNRDSNKDIISLEGKVEDKINIKSYNQLSSKSESEGLSSSHGNQSKLRAPYVVAANKDEKYKDKEADKLFSDYLLLEIILLNLTEIGEYFPDSIKDKFYEDLYLKRKKFTELSCKNFENFNLPFSLLYDIFMYLNLFPELITNEEFIYIGKIELNSSLIDMMHKAGNGNNQSKRHKHFHKKEYELFLRFINGNDSKSLPNQGSLVELILNDISIIIKRENKKVIDQCKNLYLSKSAHELKNPIAACNECLLELKDNLENLIQEKNFDSKIKKVVNKSYYSQNINSSKLFYSAEQKAFLGLNKGLKRFCGDNSDSKDRIIKILEYLSLQLNIMNQFLDGVGIFSTKDNIQNNYYANYRAQENTKDAMMIMSPSKNIENKEIKENSKNKNGTTNKASEQISCIGIGNECFLNNKAKSKNCQNLNLSVLIAQDQSQKCDIIEIITEQIKNFNYLIHFENKSSVNFSDIELTGIEDEKNLFIYSSLKLIKSMIFYIFHHCYKHIASGVVSVKLQKLENFDQGPQSILLSIITPQVLFDQNIVNFLSENLGKNMNDFEYNHVLKNSLINNIHSNNTSNKKANDNNLMRSHSIPNEIGMHHFSCEEFSNYFYVYIILILAKKLRVKIKIENKSYSTAFKLLFNLDKTTTLVKPKDSSNKPVQDGKLSINHKKRKSFDLPKINNRKFYTTTIEQPLIRNINTNADSNHKNVNFTILSVYQNNYINIINNKQSLTSSPSDSINNNNKENNLNKCDSGDEVVLLGSCLKKKQDSYSCFNSQRSLTESQKNSERFLINDSEKKKQFKRKLFYNPSASQVVEDSKSFNYKANSPRSSESYSSSFDSSESMASSDNIQIISSKELFSSAFSEAGESKEQGNRKASEDSSAKAFEKNKECLENHLNETKVLKEINLNFDYVTNSIGSKFPNIFENMQESFCSGSINCTNRVTQSNKTPAIFPRKVSLCKKKSNSNLNKIIEPQAKKVIDRDSNKNKIDPNYINNLAILYPKIPIMNIIEYQNSLYSRKNSDKKNDNSVRQTSSKYSHSKENDLLSTFEERKVLIVEDEEVIRNSLKRFFNKINEENFKENKTFKYVTYEANNGLEAIGVIYNLFMKNLNFDFAITDEMMPYLKGSGLVKFIKQLVREGNFYDIPFVSYTAYNEDLIKNVIINSGVEFIINKPVDYVSFKNFISLLETKLPQIKH